MHHPCPSPPLWGGLQPARDFSPAQTHPQPMNPHRNARPPRFQAILKSYVLLPVLLIAAATLSPAQETKIEFPDEGRPRMLKTEILNGRITVRGYPGKQALIQVSDGAPTTREPGFSITSQNNVITISGGLRRSANLTIQIPFETSLQLRCTNCGELRVENVKGEIDVNATNGAIRLQNVSGSILAYTLNQGITAVIDQLDPSKPSSFSSMNGTIDCTFPADLKANVRLRTENGRIHTDFDIRLSGGTVIRTDRGLSGTIGGPGGPDVQFKAFNGSIYLRKK